MADDVEGEEHGFEFSFDRRSLQPSIFPLLNNGCSVSGLYITTDHDLRKPAISFGTQHNTSTLSWTPWFVQDERRRTICYSPHPYTLATKVCDTTQFAARLWKLATLVTAQEAL
jgi:hypothetical protein